MEAHWKLRRFCFLGSFDPVYTHLRTDIAVDKYWPLIHEYAKQFTDIDMVRLLEEVLHQCALVRKDEVIFVYAVCLASDADIKWKTALRVAFRALIRTDDELFLFCKYTTMINKLHNRKGLSRTVRKAITSWYEVQTDEALRNMWMCHRGQNGFTHKALMKLCHISDATLGSAHVALPFFKTCTELLNVKEGASVPIAKPNDSEGEQQVPTDSNDSTPGCPSRDEEETKDEQSVTSKRPPTHQELIAGVSKLRITKKNHDALKIIRKYKLSYNQVPGHLLSYSPIMIQVLPTMTPFQILKCWRKMAKNEQFDNGKLFKLCKSRLENKELAKEINIQPIHFLINMREIGVVNELSKLPSRKVEAFKMEYLNKLYYDSFQWQTGSGNLRWNITVNLQSNYKKKFLKNHRKLTYYEACMALAYGYSKREAFVDIFYWNEEINKLNKIVFDKDVTTYAGLNCFDGVQNIKNNQRLVAPIMNALASEQVYDVFLCIVPTAGRSNPSQNSDFLCKFLDKYRETKNPNAKFVILDLLKFKRSMGYSETRKENILEICGLDEHTPDLIHNFVTHRFD